MGVSQDDLSAVCAGTTETLDLLGEHLTVTVKPVRKVIVSPASQQAPDAEFVDDKESDPYVGTRSGAGQLLVFKDYSALSVWAAKQAEDENSMRLRVNRTDDRVDYADAHAESDEERGCSMEELVAREERKAKRGDS